MSPLDEIKFLGQVAEFSRSELWDEIRSILHRRSEQHIIAGSMKPDPMAGRMMAAAAEIAWLIDFVDSSEHRERECAAAMKESAEEEARQQREKQAAETGEESQMTTE